MSQPIPTSPGAVVIDANILIAICSQEPTYTTAEQALAANVNKCDVVRKLGALSIWLCWLKMDARLGGLRNGARLGDSTAARGASVLNNRRAVSSGCQS